MEYFSENDSLPQVESSDVCGADNSVTFDEQVGLRTTGGSPIILKKVLGLMLDGLPLELTNIAASVSIMQWQEAIRGAHSIKGDAAMMGALALSSLAYKLEDAAKSQDTSLCNEYCYRIQSEEERLRQALVATNWDTLD